MALNGATMITYSNVEGFLKSKNARQWLVAIWITVTALSPSALLWYMLEKSLAQTQVMFGVSNSWMERTKIAENEAVKWRTIASRASLQAAVCAPAASKCDAEKCINVCTGTPAMESRR